MPRYFLTLTLIVALLRAVPLYAATPTTATAPATAPAVYTLPLLTSLIPASVLPLQEDHWTEAKAQAAQDAMSKVTGANVRFNFLVKAVFHDTKNKRWRIDMQTTPAGGLRYVLHFWTEDTTQAASVNEGQSADLSGVLTGVKVTTEWRGLVNRSNPEPRPDLGGRGSRPPEPGPSPVHAVATLEIDLHPDSGTAKK